MIILGIDHGNTSTGWGLIESEFGKPFKYVAHGLIEDPMIHYPVTLHKFTDMAGELIDKHKPDMIALEAPKDNKGFIATQKLTELVGCFKRLAISKHIPFSEIPPSTMKLMIAGNGHATKEDVADKVASILGLKFEDIATIEYYKQGLKRGQIKSYKLDASDALGLAIALQPYIKRIGGMDYDPRKI